MSRTEQILSSLKDFQRDTVDFVFKRMYEGPAPVMRYLIADEVGLGKTMVAKGIVARAVDHLRECDPHVRIDVVYICSNASIARQNIKRLNVTGRPCHDLPDRITLLPRDIKKLRGNEVNFIAFTPGTSLNLRSSEGKADERALLYRLLPADWLTNERGSISLLTAWMRRDRFKGRVDDLTSAQVDDKLRSAFQAELLKASRDTANKRATLRDRFRALADQIGGRAERLSDDEIRERAEIIGALRSILAAVCIESLEPDLVILDEFQRFSDLLHGTDDASQLAQQLFRYKDARVLLLSATPYRMFTTADDPGGDGHYSDLIQTIKFLQNDPNQTEAFQAALACYGRELLRFGLDGSNELKGARDAVKGLLHGVMVRTERLAMTTDRRGMLKEVACPDVSVVERDVEAFLALQRLARTIQVADVTEYWKSAPYLLNFMEDYDLKRDFESRVKSGRLSSEGVDALTAESAVLLSKDDVSAYREMDPGNARLRHLVQDTLGKDAWQWLWIPPSWPYYELEGEYANAAARLTTKRLIFSSWQVVPKVVAAFLTYEAERRMLGIPSEGEPGSRLAEATKKRSGRLRFSETNGRLTGMAVLGLMYPSFTLAAECDPLAWKGMDGPTTRPTLERTLERARVRCRELLSGLRFSGEATGPEDQRWYWAAPIVLDVARNSERALAWFGQANLVGKWRGEDTPAPDEDVEDIEGDTAWVEHVRVARSIALDPAELGRPPADLADVLSLNAVAGPAVTALRALARVSGGLQLVSDISIRNDAGTVAEGLRSLFNQPEATVMLRDRQESVVDGAAEDGASLEERSQGRQWRRVLEYSARGGLQSVLDEYAHVLVEHLGMAGRPLQKISRDVSKAIREALTLRRSTLSADAIEVDSANKAVKIADNELRFRASFAVRYGGRSPEEARTVLREGDVQKAFNSPFRPFVLCSTSVGQEGLDFHLYCHAVMHWNLPSNPVDLEQREGRVHRYKGHAIRKNVVQSHAAQVQYTASGPSSDPWRQLFDAARLGRPAQSSDLVPFWVHVVPNGAQIERHVPMIPLSKDVDRADLLRRSLAVYRMAFGQSRQDDLVSYLQRYLTPEQIEKAASEMRIDLAPGQSSNRHCSGVLQVPGELEDDDEDTSTDSSVGLHDLESLLDAFAHVRPGSRQASAAQMEQLLNEFATFTKV